MTTAALSSSRLAATALRAVRRLMLPTLLTACLSRASLCCRLCRSAALAGFRMVAAASTASCSLSGTAAGAGGSAAGADGSAAGAGGSATSAVAVPAGATLGVGDGHNLLPQSPARRLPGVCGNSQTSCMPAKGR